MALKSMTGFGEARKAFADWVIQVELSTVNRKQLDIQLNLPKPLAACEADLNRWVRGAIARGRVSGFVRIEPARQELSEKQINMSKARAVVKAYRMLAKELNIEPTITLEMLTRHPEIFNAEESLPSPELWRPALEEVVQTALKKLSKMRRAEGRALEQDLRERIGLLEQGTRAIQKRIPQQQAHYRDRLEGVLKKEGFNLVEAEERIIREIALFVERTDITEELTRLKSHLKQMRAHLRSVEPVGRPLDFLSQELFREINTIGSKASDRVIAHEVVAFKGELERLREQVQNVE